MKKKILYGFIFISLLLTTGCGSTPKLQDGEEIVATINGKNITAEELYQEMKKQSGAGALVNLVDSFIANKEIPTDNDVKEYADSQLEQVKLQYQQSGDDFTSALLGAGYKNEDALKDVIIIDYKQNKMVENYVKDSLTDEEIEKYYNEDIFGALTVKHILIKPDVTDDMTSEEKTTAEEEALEKAKDLITQLDNGADFDELAKEHSDDEGTKDDGGLFSGFTKDDVVPEFWDASYKLENNQYTKSPVKSTYGYHVIMKISTEDKPALEDVESTIKDKLFAQEQQNDQDLNMRIWAKIRENYKLDIADSEIKTGYENSLNQIK